MKTSLAACMIGAAAAADLETLYLMNSVNREPLSGFGNAMVLQDKPEEAAEQVKIELFKDRVFGDNPTLYQDLFRGREITPRQRIGAILASTGSESPILPIINSQKLSKDENFLRNAFLFGAFTGYPGSTGRTQRLVPLLAGDYPNKPRAQVPLTLIAAGAPGDTEGIEEAVDLFLDDLDVVTWKDIYALREMKVVEGDATTLANPWLMDRYFDMDEEDEPVVAKDLLDDMMVSGIAMIGNKGRYIYEILDTDVLLTGDNLEYYLELAAGKLDASMIYDYLENVDVMTGKVLEISAAMLELPLAAGMFDDDEELTVEDFEEWAVFAGLRTDPLKWMTMKKEDKVKPLTPVEFFEKAGIIGEDAADFFLDTMDGEITAEDYVKMTELRDGPMDPVEKVMFERYFDDEEIVTASKLQDYKLILERYKAPSGTPRPIEPTVYKTLRDYDSPLTNKNVKVIEGATSGKTVSGSTVTDFLEDGGITGRNFIISSASMGRPVNPFVASVVDEDEEMTGKQYLKTQIASGKSNTYLATQFKDYRDPLTVKDWVAADGIVNQGTAAGSMVDSLGNMRDLGIISTEDVLFAATTNALKGSDKPSLSKNLFGAMALTGRLDRDDFDIVDDTLPWMTSTGRTDYIGKDVADVLGDEMGLEALVKWTGAGTIGQKPAPTNKPWTAPPTTKPWTPTGTAGAGTIGRKPAQPTTKPWTPTGTVGRKPVYRPTATSSSTIQKPVSTGVPSLWINPDPYNDAPDYTMGFGPISP
jgi:hypothetical protein